MFFKINRYNDTALQTNTKQKLLRVQFENQGEEKTPNK